MKSMKKAVSLVTSFCCLALGVTHASAWNYTPDLFSLPGTSNIWNTEPAYSLAYSSSYNHVCGGDVEVRFYNNNVGLQTSFVQNGARYAYFQVYEDDLIFPDVFARSYQGSFTLISGYYRPANYIETSTSSDTLENDGEVEMYMKIFITTLPGDTSTATPAGLIKYKYRVI